MRTPTQDPDATGGPEDDEFMMELEAARAAMEEQTARREALRKGEEGEGGEEAEGGRGRGAGVAVASVGSYNKVRRDTGRDTMRRRHEEAEGRRGGRWGGLAVTPLVSYSVVHGERWQCFVDGNKRGGGGGIRRLGACVVTSSLGSYHGVHRHTEAASGVWCL